jgi:hypothetical protein
MDLQISIVASHGPSSWDGIVEQGKGVGSGKSMLLRTANGSEVQFAKGERIRVLDAHVSASANNGEQPLVATTTAISEIFLLT